MELIIILAKRSGLTLMWTLKNSAQRAPGRQKEATEVYIFAIGIPQDMCLRR